MADHTDVDWAGSVGDCRSTLGYVFSLGSAAVSWCNMKQPTMALSNTDEGLRSRQVEERRTKRVVECGLGDKLAEGTEAKNQQSK